MSTEENKAIIIITALASPKRQYKILKLIIYLIISLGLCGGILVYVFAFALKNTEEYACVLKFVKEDKTVLQTVGEPVEPGLTVWCSYFEKGGGVRQTGFSFSVTGPKGHGQVKASTYRAPIGSSMSIRFEGQEIYNGVYPCP